MTKDRIITQTVETYNVANLELTTVQGWRTFAFIRLWSFRNILIQERKEESRTIEFAY